MVIEIQDALKKIFPLVDLYTAAIATYPGNWWAFAIASKGVSPRELRNKRKIKARYYSTEVHQQSFMPRELYEKLMKRKLEW
jgi:spermidine synthase